MKIEDEIKGRFRNDYHRGIINLIYTVNHLNYDFMQHLKKHNLSEPQYNVLRVLKGFCAEGPVSLGFIKDRMLDKNSDVSRIVDKLFCQGLVARSENKSDRRQKDIFITEKGLSLIASMIDCEYKTDSLLDNLSESEIQELNRLLDKIREKPMTASVNP
jgi:DNA-binding MarR family transcriptional regulator